MKSQTLGQSEIGYKIFNTCALAWNLPVVQKSLNTERNCCKSPEYILNVTFHLSQAVMPGTMGVLLDLCSRWIHYFTAGYYTYAYILGHYRVRISKRYCLQIYWRLGHACNNQHAHIHIIQWWFFFWESQGTLMESLCRLNRPSDWRWLVTTECNLFERFALHV